jgi:hypothetical protein
MVSDFHTLKVADEMPKRHGLLCKLFEVLSMSEM